MKITGISDEAGPTIAEQIQAHKELGWTHLELRKVDGEEVALPPWLAPQKLVHSQ
ncbi:MAG: hypothetical protein ACFCUX_09905 [Candidatus Methylacidiphilales bacterium]